MTHKERLEYYINLCKKLFPGCPYPDVVMSSCLSQTDGILNTYDPNVGDRDKCNLAVGAYIRHNLCGNYSEMFHNSRRVGNKNKIRKQTTAQFNKILESWKKNNK